MHPELLRRWTTVSGLLDEALALPAAEREAWISRLGPAHEALVPHLRRLLGHEPAATEALLEDALPRYDPARIEADGAGPSRSAGDRVGAFRLVRELGRGGMGTVWLAERAQAGASMPVALKLPHVEGAASVIRERFERERDILAALNHPRIARLLEAGVADDGQPFLAIEYVEGDNLLAHCKAKALPVRERVRLFVQVLDAVAYAHANLVIHRDLKPPNILVTTTGDVKLLDFGIAKLVDRSARGVASTELTQRAGHVMTPDYASPEQVAGLPLTTASDVYSLGVLLFELLTGTRPYRLKRGTRAELEEAILSAEAPLPSTAVTAVAALGPPAPLSRWRRLLRGDLDTIVLAAMKRLPAERYSGAGAFREDLERYLHGRPVLARPESAAYRFAKFVQRHKVAVGASALVSLALVGGLSVALWQAHVASAEARKALAVQGFLTSLFERNSRMQAGAAKARNQTVREALVEASEKVPTAFRDSPELAAELSKTVAYLLVDVEEFERADKLFRDAIALEKANGRVGSALHVDALLGLTSTARLLGRAPEALAARDEALVLLDARGDRTSLLRARALASSVYYMSRDTPREIRLATEARELLETHHPASPERFAATFVLAQIHRGQAQWGKAEPLFREAIALFATTGSKDYLNLAGAHAWAAFCAARKGRGDQAIRDYETGLRLLDETAGAEAQSTRFHRGIYASVLHHSGRRAEAHAVWEALARGLPDGRPATAVDFDNAVYRAEAYLEEGAPVAAIAQLEPYAGRYVDFGKRFIPNGVHWATLLAKANAMLGRDDAARRALARLDELPSTYYIPPRQLIDYKDDVGWMLVARGQAAEARAALAFGDDDVELPVASFDGGVVRVNIRAAQAAAVGGDAATALKHADRALGMIATHSRRELHPSVVAAALQARGEALLLAGKAGEALGPLEEAARLQRGFGGPDSLWLADALAIVARARQRLGQAAEAEAARGEARRIHRRHPTLSPFLTARLLPSA